MRAGRARARHRCIRSGRGARRVSWSRCSSARRRASARRSARPGSGGRPARSGARSSPRSGGSDRSASPPAVVVPGRMPPDSPDERHPLSLDRVEAHAQGRRLLLGHLADVGRLLVGGHRAPADDPLRLADHQPGQVVAVHAPPGRRQQVVRALEPDLEPAERRVGAQALALVDELAGRGDQLVARHASTSPRIIASRSRARPPGPRPGQAGPDRRALEAGHRQDAGDARGQERLVGGRQVGRCQAPLDRLGARPGRPSPGATSGWSRAGSRSRATAWRAPGRRPGRDGPGRCSRSWPPTGGRPTVRKSASSAPARRASRRA